MLSEVPKKTKKGARAKNPETYTLACSPTLKMNLSAGPQDPVITGYCAPKYSSTQDPRKLKTPSALIKFEAGRTGKQGTFSIKSFHPTQDDQEFPSLFRWWESTSERGRERHSSGAQPR